MEQSKTRPAIRAQNAEQSTRCVRIFATRRDEPASFRRELTAFYGHDAAHTGDGVARQLPGWSYRRDIRTARGARGKDDMYKPVRIAVGVVGTVVMLVALSGVARADEKSTVEEIRKELMQLPYYGVFDYLAFKYDKGTVTLMGYAYALGLKRDAERAVKRVAGVDQVVDKVEELPASPMDDELRWKVYYAIYRNPFLSRYAPGGGLLWGSHRAYGPGFHGLSGGLFPGMEPVGDYPIHIIVKNLRVTLLGVVDNESDKTVAGMKAREVPGSLGVDNQLIVVSEEKSTKR